MNKLGRTLCGALCALIAACSEDTKQPEEGVDFSSFDARVEAFLEEHSLAGASAVIVHKDRGVLHERGYGDFAADRMYLIASASKVLSVGVLMRLSDQGLLDIDAPVSGYLSEWGEHKTDISTASLVSNSSGLVSLTENALYLPYICQYVESGTLTDCAQTIYTADDANDRRPPDTMFLYGGGQWQLAGGIAEVVSGKSWAELIDETYVSPCEASTLGYSNHYQRANSGGAALDYPAFFMADPGNLPDTDNPSIEGGAYIAARDYGKILLMHLRGGRCGEEQVLSGAAVARMQEDRIAEAYGGSTNNPNLEGYGLGWWIDREHPGVFVDPGAYGAVAWLDLTRDYGAFVALESSAEVGETLRRAVQPLLEELLDEGK